MIIYSKCQKQFKREADRKLKMQLLFKVLPIFTLADLYKDMNTTEYNVGKIQ